MAPSRESTVLVARALEGDGAAVRELLTMLTPVIQARAARALARAGKGAGRDARQELGDLVQDVALVLFRDGGRVLRAWEPARGLSLLNYVGLVAEREVGQIARSGRRSPWSLDPREESEIEAASAHVPSSEAAVASRDLFDQLYLRLEEELNDNAMQLFRLLIVEEQGAAEVAEAMGLSTDAVYTWRSRLLKRARQIIAELAPSSGSMPAAPIPVRSGTP